MANGDVYLEEWENNLLISQTQLITIEDNLHSSQKLEKKSGKEKTENKSNELNPTQIEENVDENKKTEIDQIKEVSKEYEENLTSEAKINDDQNEGNLRPNLFETENNIGDLESQLLNTKYESIAEKDLLSEMKSELKTLDGGFDTLALIEQIEMFNSLNSCFLNKNSTLS